MHAGVEDALAQATQLGLGPPIAISAETGGVPASVTSVGHGGEVARVCAGGVSVRGAKALLQG